MKINRNIKMFWPASYPVDSWEDSDPKGTRKRKRDGDHPQKQIYKAYPVDGSKVIFTHAIDYIQALLSGKFTSTAQPEEAPAEQIKEPEPIKESDLVIDGVEKYEK